MADGSALVPKEATATRPQVGPTRRPLMREWLPIGIIAWSLYLLACTCPVFVDVSYSDYPAPPQPVIGWQLLVWGWLWVFLFVPAAFPWSANVLLLWGWIGYVQGRSRRAAACGVMAVVAGLITYAMPVERLLVGYYLWQASLLIFAAASARQWWHDQARLPLRVAEPLYAPKRLSYVPSTATFAFRFCMS